MYSKEDADSLLDKKAEAEDVYTKEETERLVNNKVVEIGGADMTKAVYDTDGNGQVDKADDSDRLGGKEAGEYMTVAVYDADNDGTVDNAQKLGGQLPEHYATQEELKAAKTAADNAATAASNAQNTADGKANASHTQAASTITAGTFPGNVVAYSSNRTTSSLRNIEVRTTSVTGTLQSTNKIIMVRK